MVDKIVIGVTVDLSLSLMEGLPETLVERGWEVHLVASPGERLSRYEGTAGVVVHPLAMKREPSPASDVLGLLRWWRLLRRVRPAAVSVGTPKAALLGLVAAALARVPVRQYLVRGLRLETTTGVTRRVLRVTERVCAIASTDIVAISDSLRRRMLELGLTGGRSVAVVGSGSSNGIDLVRFDPTLYSESRRDELASSLGLSPSSAVVGYVGRLAADKGIGDLVDALAELHSNGVDVQLLLVGSFEEESVKQRVEAARSTGLTIITPGYDPDPARYLATMDVFCIPSRREGFGNAAIEASAMELPVVATAVTGLVDAVEDGETGLLSEAGDLPQLARHLETLLRDPELRSTLGRAGRARARERFERSRVQGLYADRLAQLTAESLGARGSTTGRAPRGQRVRPARPTDADHRDRGVR